MRVILSRKGFEPAKGGIPSPIMPDGTLLLLPKPDEDGIDSYYDFSYEDMTYYDIVCSLSEELKEPLKNYRCHSECYIPPEHHIHPSSWFPAYLRYGAMQTHLSHQRISVGDIFLFYGWFRQTAYDSNHKLHFVPDAPEQTIIFSYFQIGAIIKDLSFLSRQFKWSFPIRTNTERNQHYTIYLPTKKLSYNNQQPGFGNLSYSKKLVLTKPGYKYNYWHLPDFLSVPDVTISYHNNRNNGFLSGKDYFKTSGISEEFVIHGTYDLKNWVYSMINTMEYAITEEEDIHQLRLIPHHNYPDDKNQIYCRQNNSITNIKDLNCTQCEAYDKTSNSNCIKCQWKDYVSPKEETLSIVDPNEEFKRVNWLLKRDILPDTLFLKGCTNHTN